MLRGWEHDIRKDRFAVGDEAWWNVPVVMACCNTWAPDTLKPVTIIAVSDKPTRAEGLKPHLHAQMVRVSPNYSPWGDEFDAVWLLPVGIRSHNDKAYWAMLEEWRRD